MRRHGVPFGALLACLVLGGQFNAVGVKADVSDDLFRTFSTAMQELYIQSTEQSSEVARKIEENVRVKNELRDVMKALDEQASKLRDLIAGENDDLKEKIEAINEQVKKLEDQAKKLEAVQEKITTLLPQLQDALGQDQSAKESRQILDAVSQDRAKVAKLLQAIEDNKRAEIGDLLGQGARGTKVDVRETSNADGAKVVFRVGNLIHCLSTKAQCGGKSSSLTKAKAGPVPSAVEAVKPLKDSLAAASKQAAASDKAIKGLLSDLEAALGSPDMSQDLAIELQRKASQVAEAVNARSRFSEKVASALEAIIGRING